MRAVAIEEYGGTDQLRMMELPRPEPRPGEVLIRIKAAGVNPVDGKIRQGLLKQRMPNFLPIVIGWDAAGVIEGLGEGVTGFSLGQPVFAYCRTTTIQHGTYAEFIAVPASSIAPKPSNLSFEEAATIPLAGLTAYQCLFDAAQLQAGQKILIHAAAGGVGGFAVQLARWRGAEIWATASSANHAYVRSLGADHVLDYTAGDFREKASNLDVAFDTIGGDVQSRSADCLKPGGVLVSILAYADEAALKAKGIVTKYVFVSPNGAQLSELGRLCQAGALRTHLAAVLRLEEAAKAHAMIESRHTRGKIALRIG